MYYDQEPLCQSNHFCSYAAANFVLKDPVVILNALSIYPRGSSIKYVERFQDSLNTPPPSLNIYSMFSIEPTPLFYISMATDIGQEKNQKWLDNRY